MKILVTGGAGAIGSNLIPRLLSFGHDVYCIDNLSTGNDENLNDARRDARHDDDQQDDLLTQFAAGRVEAKTPNTDLRPGRFFFAGHNVIEPLDAETVKQLFGEDVQFDRIYWLACPASPPQYQRDPVYTLRTSVWGTYNGLELARRLGARFLLSSTSEVYGDPEVHPQPESYRGNVNCTGIRACYDEGKRASETLCFDYMRFHKVEVRVARIFNTYGPNMDIHDGRVISNFIVQAIKGEPLTIYGDGSQTRSFCFVSDMVDGLIMLMEGTNVAGPVNLGNPEEHTIAEMADIIRDVADSGSKVVHMPLPADDPKQRRPVIDMAREQLGWEPKMPLRDGLQMTIEYFRNKLARGAEPHVKISPHVWRGPHPLEIDMGSGMLDTHHSNFPSSSNNIM